MEISTGTIKQRGTFETLGGIGGVAYGLYFAHSKQTAWWGYIFWAVIFGLAIHEIGEQVDRVMKKP